MKDSTKTTGTSNTSGKCSDTREDRKMSEKEFDENAIDPPSNDGGGKAEPDASEDKAAIDPPSNDGGN
ncbi:MAG: hypothetical protein DMF69_17915 [Acidobacteria bacterium]|nr:MAG: hypothetical protein DMF69_17915 [Acidobacteriota bacterium]